MSYTHTICKQSTAKASAGTGDRVTHPCNVETMEAEVSFCLCNIFFRLYVHCSNYWLKYTQ